jgi:hypothetical protein
MSDLIIGHMTIVNVRSADADFALAEWLLAVGALSAFIAAQVYWIGALASPEVLFGV